MTLPVVQDWQPLAIYAVLAALVLVLLLRVPYLGALIRAGFTIGVLAIGFFILFQQAPYDPRLAKLANGLGLDRQQVVGREVRIPIAADGHFWATATVNGVKRRMLIDSGATVTGLSQDTVERAGVKSSGVIGKVMLQTASGVAVAGTATVDEIKVGPITARKLKIVTSPALGNFDVLGMNFLSKLASWRVENNTMILVPHPPSTNTKEPNAR